MQTCDLTLPDKWKQVEYAKTFPDRSNASVKASQTAWKNILGQLEKTVCHACCGFGHHIKDCPTDRKLVAFGQSDGVWRTLHKDYLDAVGLKNSKTLKGDAPMGSLPQIRQRSGPYDFR